MNKWFERHASHFEGDPLAQLHSTLHQANVHEALNDMAGSIGVSRFLIYFEIDGKKVKIGNLEAEKLEYGGGPPQNLGNSFIDVLKIAISNLARLMPHTPFEKGCLGFLRDYENNYELLCFFDEDSETATLDLLPIPKYGHPLQDPEYRRLLGDMELQLSKVIQQSARVSSEWDEWSIENNQLRLVYREEGGMEEYRTYPIVVLSTFAWSEYVWNWQVDDPLFQESTFTCREFLATWELAMELGYASTARLSADWLFVGTIEDSTVLLGAVWER
ncbi:MAG: hypothetical protein VX278_11870 [Myxococcota bacterium]|nr:hypothetical protein [Myxococcota bacterium]